MRARGSPLHASLLDLVAIVEVFPTAAKQTEQFASKGFARDAVEKEIDAEVRQHEQLADLFQRLPSDVLEAVVIVDEPNSAVRRVQQQKRTGDEQQRGRDAVRAGLQVGLQRTGRALRRAHRITDRESGERTITSLEER